MIRKKLLPVALIAVVAGWSGGSFSGIFFKSELGMAQDLALPAKVLSTEEIRIMGKDGGVRAVLGTRDDGATSLAFYDGKGKVRAEMGINAAGVAEMALYDQEGKQQKPHGFIYMHVPPTSGPRLSLVGEAANLTIASEGLAGYATLKIEPDNNPVLSLEGEDKGAALLTMLQDGSPSLTLYDPEGYRRAALEIKEMRVPGKEPAPKSTLTLYDKNEKITWSAP